MKFLIIQTAFIGDVILATPVIEQITGLFPGAEIDFLLRKGNESLLNNNPHIHQLIVWNKKSRKYRGLVKIIRGIRAAHYDYVINLQRFTTTGIITALSKAKTTIGFDKNPLSGVFTHVIKHTIGDGTHETERNLMLLERFGGRTKYRPTLYPSKSDYESVSSLQTQPYICIAPGSVWFTKQYPVDKWIELIEMYYHLRIYLLGGPDDSSLCDEIISKCNQDNLKSLAGTLTFLQSAALMQKAEMNFVNDSAPLHIASAVNAKVTAIFCSTIPDFGFGPLSDHSKIAEVKYDLYCRPCNLHGQKECPEKHFKCAYDIDPELLKIAE